MRRMIGKLLDQYGTEVELGERIVRAIFQPMTGSMDRLAARTPQLTGWDSGKRFLYIGPVDPLPGVDGTVTVAGVSYRVRSAQHIPGNDGPAYSWALCVEKGREDTWGTDC